MSVRYDGAAEYFRRTTDLIDYKSNYTWMCNFYLVTGADVGYCNILTIDTGNDFTHSDEVAVEGDLTRILVTSNTNFSFNAVAATTTPQNGVWYNVAMVRRANNALDLYINGILEATSTDDTSGRGAGSQTEMLIGSGYGGTFNQLDGRIANIKVWSTNLTAAEVLSEVSTIRPRKLENLYSWTPVFPGSGERARDYSGNGRDWTETGTLTDEEHPPVSWGAKILALPFVSTGATQFTQDVAGAFAPAGSIIKSTSKLLTGSLSSIAGSLIKQTSKLISGSFTTTGTLASTHTFSQLLTGTLTSAGSIILQTGKLLSGSVTPAGAVSKFTSKLLTGTFTPTGALANQFAATLGGVLSTAGSLSKSTLKVLSGSFTPSGILVGASVFLQSLTGSLTPTGALLKQAQKSLSGSVASSSSLIVSISKLVTGTVSTAGSVTKMISRSLSGALQFVGDVGGQSVFLLSLTGALSISGSIIKSADKLVSGSITPTGSINKLISSLISGIISPVGDLSKNISKLLSGSVIPSGLLNSIRMIVVNITASLGLSGTLAKKPDKILTGSITSSGSIVKSTGKILSGLLTFVGNLITSSSASVYLKGDAYVRDEALYNASISDGPVNFITITDSNQGD
jgi:hypothetical protein